jgi:hypothetical protein
MKRSTDRILVTHQGTLPRPDDLRDMLSARSSGQLYDQGALAERIQRAVKEVVQQQVEYGGSGRRSSCRRGNSWSLAWSAIVATSSSIPS